MVGEAKSQPEPCAERTRSFVPLFFAETTADRTPAEGHVNGRSRQCSEAKT